MASFEGSLAAAARLERLVPCGAHTYAKGPDQYPADRALIIDRGAGSHVWDVDGNEYVEYGSGLRAVILGHARREVDDAVIAQVRRGMNTSSGRRGWSWLRPRTSSTPCRRTW